MLLLLPLVLATLLSAPVVVAPLPSFQVVIGSCVVYLIR